VNNNNVEVEIKFPLPVVLQSFYALMWDQLKPKLETPRHLEHNLLFKSPGVMANGATLRLRRSGEGDATLTYKDKKGVSGNTKYKHRRELETLVSNGDIVEEILETLGFEVSFAYEKVRSVYAVKGGKIMIDETPIGNFGELEGPPEWIDATAAKLGIKSEDYLTLSYPELFSQWKKQTGSKAEYMTFDAFQIAMLNINGRK